MEPSKRDEAQREKQVSSARASACGEAVVTVSAPTKRYSGQKPSRGVGISEKQLVAKRVPLCFRSDSVGTDKDFAHLFFSLRTPLWFGQRKGKTLYSFRCAEAHFTL
ncbi:hypothetical protein LOK74_17975 [Brevibacillus humidisoli]|uniref:hypothetical protein n=1 Tax=Brevibacillus humidisoli TaxID=2895522 RepID=UPI001E331FDB|nr:hypothetical protein [Brevibacillus humidisoli]UFJ39919.1 hypothetical protein LOK74_17975 [Brevibacillus humidisoli]